MLVRVHREKITKKLQLKPDNSSKDDRLADEAESQDEELPSPVSNRPRIMNILNS